MQNVKNIFNVTTGKQKFATFFYIQIFKENTKIFFQISISKKKKEALSEYFDAGLDPPENLAVNEEVAASLLSFYEENEPAAEAEQPMASLEFGDNRPRALLKSLNVLGKIMDRMAEISISFLFINTNPDVLQSTFVFYYLFYFNNLLIF